jgi:hypothetical protein
MGAPWVSRADTSGTVENRKGSQRAVRFSLPTPSPSTQKRHTEVVLPLPLLLLELEGDTTDGSALNPLHQVGGEPSDLVAETLGRDDGDLIADLLVGVAGGVRAEVSN